RLLRELPRASLLVWLLLTLPAVCHHQTAAALLGAFHAPSSHTAADAASIGPTHIHGVLAGAQPAGSESAQAAGRDASGSRLEWCAHHGDRLASSLPDGQEGVALLG